MTKSEIEVRVDLATKRLRRKYCEDQMTKATKSIANQLREIHDLKLWEGDYPTFEEYCRGRWGISRQRAYQMIGTEGDRMTLRDSTDSEELKTVIDGLDESHVAAISKAPIEKRVKVLTAAIEAPGKMTTNKIKRIAVTVVPSLAPIQLDDTPKVCPTCKQTIC